MTNMMNVALLIQFHNIIPVQFFANRANIFCLLHIREATNKSWDVNETFLVTSLIPYYAETGRVLSPNRLTLQITLMYEDFPFPTPP